MRSHSYTDHRGWPEKRDLPRERTRGGKVRFTGELGEDWRIHRRLYSYIYLSGLSTFAGGEVLLDWYVRRYSMPGRTRPGRHVFVVWGLGNQAVGSRYGNGSGPCRAPSGDPSRVTSPQSSGSQLREVRWVFGGIEWGASCSGPRRSTGYYMKPGLNSYVVCGTLLLLHTYVCSSSAGALPWLFRLMVVQRRLGP